MYEPFIAGESDPQQCKYKVAVFDAEGHAAGQLSPRFDLANHSPTGFAWGYAGSGPAQLALAMLCFATGDDEIALRYYQRYKNECVSRFPPEWKMPVRIIQRWVKKQSSPYGSMCMDPDLCAGKDSCPRDPTCGD